MCGGIHVGHVVYLHKLAYKDGPRRKMLKIQVKSALKCTEVMSMLFPNLVFYPSKKCKSNFGEEQVKMVVKADHDVEQPILGAAHTKCPKFIKQIKRTSLSFCYFVNIVCA